MSQGTSRETFVDEGSLGESLGSTFRQDILLCVLPDLLQQGLSVYFSFNLQTREVHHDVTLRDYVYVKETLFLHWFFFLGHF